jgi:glycogen(starch) synthase
MRILLLSWEYPPRIHGGLGRHVHALSLALARAGHEVHVVTRPHADAPLEEERDGVHVVRAPEPPPMLPAQDWVANALAVNTGLQTTATRLLNDVDVDVIHAHDWLVAYAAGGVRITTGLPLVATIHATEYGRHQGHLPGPMNKFIHQAEWWLTYEARRVITCSRYMRDQAQRIFELPPGKIDTIPNGVAPEEFTLVPGNEVSALRERITPDGEHLVLYAGRLEYEKGVQTLLRAVRKLRDRGLPVRLLIAGEGTYAGSLRELARSLRIARAVDFTGFLDRADLVRHYRVADVAVTPSIYEPFGIVALEAMAAGTPLVVSDTGGLGELVEHERSGLKVAPQDVGALTDALTRVLGDRDWARGMAVVGHNQLERRFSWDAITSRTVETYERAVREERELAHAQRPPLRLIFSRSPLLGGSAEA